MRTVTVDMYQFDELNEDAQEKAIEWVRNNIHDLYAFHDKFKSTGDALRAFNHALDEGFEAWRSDWEDAYSDDSIADFLRTNEYEFTEDGDK